MRLSAPVTCYRGACAAALALLLAGCAALPEAPEPGISGVPSPTVDSAAAPTAIVVAPPVAPPPQAPQPTPSVPDAARAQDGTKLSPAAAAIEVQPAAAPLPLEPTPVLIDPLRPEVQIDPDEVDDQIDLWTRVRQGFAMPDLEGKLVRAQEQWYASRPDYVQRMTERGGRYLFHIVQEVERRGLPTELALLPFIESAFNPEAMSSARASGMWQFMPATGRVFALKQNVFRDDRRDVLASTRAALDYLEKLYGMFGDWHLALAAYNWGEGSVGRAIAKNRAAGKPTDYASLKMPNETRHYVPKFQAVKNIIARPGDFGLALPELDNHPYFLSVPIQRDIDVDVAARLAGLSVEEFRALNPQMNKPVILAAGTPQVLLPFDNASRFVQELPEYTGRLASWTAWVAAETLKPAEAARRVGMDEAQLRQLNSIPQHMLIKAGSTLLVPRADTSENDVSEHVADNGTIVLSPDGTQVRRVQLRAGRRDTVASVARRYRLSQENVAQWNATDVGSAFRPGQKVIVFVAAKSAPRGSVATKAPSAKPATKVVRTKGSGARPTLRARTPKPLTSLTPPVKVARR
jgi:membrane-bound lytic murein transglycosylase D